MSDLVPVICIVFEQPIKTAPRMDLLRVARFVKPACAVRNEDLRYKIGHDWKEWNDYMYIIHEQKPARTSCFCPIFFLFSKFEGFSNRAYIYKLTDIFEYQASNSKLEFLPKLTGLRVTGGKHVDVLCSDISSAHFTLSQNVSFHFCFLCFV